MNEHKLTRSWCAPRPRSLIGLMKTIKLAVDDTKDSQTTSGLGRKGPEPRSVLGAPLILANKDMPRGAATLRTLLAGHRGDASPRNTDRSVLGAPVILANKDLQGGHLVIQIVKRHGNLQETPVLIDDGMIAESWQEWHDNVQVQILDRFWALP